MRGLLVLLCVMMAMIQPATAQTDTGWSIVVQCFESFNQPPDGWTFDGAIMLHSYRRLHAYEQGWETPRIPVFYDQTIPFTGQLSPDGRWFATIEGTDEVTQPLLRVVWHTNAVRIHSTVDDTTYTYTWLNDFTAGTALIGHGLYWLANDHLLYSTGDTYSEIWHVLNPFTGELTDWEQTFNPTCFDFQLSPDGQKGVCRRFRGYEHTLHNGQDEHELLLYAAALWLPDSSGFAAYTPDLESYRADQLVLFNLDGEITDVVFDVPENTNINNSIYNPALSLYNDSWSFDGRYLFFATDRLYIADREGRQVIDTCIEANNSSTAAWSLNSTQFAFINSRAGREIWVFDLETWERYVVAYHSGSVIGWRGGD